MLCFDLPNAKEFGGTSEVITEPAATYDFLPTLTGATSEEFEPIKTLFNFKAINITIGLPFIRISPDHGPNSDMVGKNKSDPSSFFYAMKFVNRLN